MNREANEMTKMLFDGSKGRWKKVTKDFRTHKKMKTNGKMITLNPDIVLITFKRVFYCRVYGASIKQDTKKEYQQNFCSAQREIQTKVRKSEERCSQGWENKNR